jgi:hypothetical protein
MHDAVADTIIVKQSQLPSDSGRIDHYGIEERCQCGVWIGEGSARTHSSSQPGPQLTIEPAAASHALAHRLCFFWLLASRLTPCFFFFFFLSFMPLLLPTDQKTFEQLTRAEYGDLAVALGQPRPHYSLEHMKLQDLLSYEVAVRQAEGLHIPEFECIFPGLGNENYNDQHNKWHGISNMDSGKPPTGFAQGE